MGRVMMEEDLRRKAEVLSKLAISEGFSLDWSAALKHRQEALELYKELDDLLNVAMTHIWLGRIFSMAPLGLADEAKALKHAEAALAILEPGPDSSDKALLLQLIARLHLQTDEPATSVVWARQAIGVFQKLGMFMGTSLGTAQARIGELDKGIEYQENNWEPTLRGGNALAIWTCGYDIILTHTLVRNMPRALEWEKTYLPVATKIMSGTFNTGPPWVLVLTYMLSGEISKATETCQMLERSKSKTPMAGSLDDSVSLGLLYFRLGNWDRAGKVLQEVLAGQEDAHNTVGVKACCFALGSLNLELGDYPKAEEFLLKSLGICQKGGNVVFELWVLPVLAELYLKTGQPDKAGEYVDRGFELLKPDKNWYGLPAPMYLAKGMLATARKDWGTAAESFDKAIQINRQYQLPWDEAKTLYERGLMYLSRGHKVDRDKAHEDLDEALAIFQKVGAKKDVEKVLRKKKRLGA
jgi:tetratricopeptide (TPR) repeat protein